MDTTTERDSLSGFVTTYINAMIAGKPGMLPIHPDTRFTEDCVEKMIGEGIWRTVTGVTPYRRDILDVNQGTAVSFLVVNEGDNICMYAVRLKVVDDKISEIETMAVHNKEEGMIFNPDNLKTVSDRMRLVPDPSRLNTRDEMIKIASKYPAGLRAGSFVKVDAQMAEDAYRYENGNLMAGPGCTFFENSEVMKTQFIPTLPEVKERIIAVDEEMGVVAMRMNFGKGSTFKGDGVLDVFHSFKIYNGLIQAAEAYCKVIPKDMPSGWD